MAENTSLLKQDQGLKSEEESSESLPWKSEDAPIAIIGMGASAGGLQALEKFFTHMPAKNGMAFVVISHQDPEQTSLLPEILQRYTEMPVVEVGESGAEARRDTVYTKPSDSDLAILQGSLILLKPARAGGAKSTVDIFFRHLAEDQDGKAVGIVLSGMGSDGTLGIKALKEHTGMTMAQEPSTAKFGSMPQSAIATGLVDYVDPAEELPQHLIDYFSTRSFEKDIGHSAQ